MEVVSPPKVGVEINLIPTPAPPGVGRVLILVLNAVDETLPMLEDMTLTGTDSRNPAKLLKKMISSSGMHVYANYHVSVVCVDFLYKFLAIPCHIMPSIWAQ